MLPLQMSFSAAELFVLLLILLLLAAPIVVAVAVLVYLQSKRNDRLAALEARIERLEAERDEDT